MGRAHPAHYINEWIRYILYGFNFMIWVFSIFVLAVGIFAVVQRTDKVSINSYIDFFTDPAIILIAVGAVIFIVTFAGCLGALNENCFFLRVYFFLLIIVFVVEIICGILTFALSGQVRERVDRVIEEAIKQYRSDDDLTNFIDFAQRELECCGGDGNYDDWSKNRYFNCTNDNISVERCGVPYSCCVGSDDPIINTQCGFDVQTKLPTQVQEIIYISGCIDKFITEVQRRSYLIGFTVFGIAAVQLLGIFLAFELCREIETEITYHSRHSATPR